MLSVQVDRLHMFTLVKPSASAMLAEHHERHAHHLTVWIVLLQRTLQIWGFAIALVFRLWWVKQKFTYGKKVMPYKPVLRQHCTTCCILALCVGHTIIQP